MCTVQCEMSWPDLTSYILQLHLAGGEIPALLSGQHIQRYTGASGTADTAGSLLYCCITLDVLDQM